MGMGAAQFGFKLFLDTQKVVRLGAGIPNYLNIIISPTVFLIIIWGIGALLLLIFKPRYYRY